MALIRAGCLKWLLLIVLAVAITGWLAGEHFLRLSSNVVAYFVRDSTGALEVRLKGGAWKPLKSVTVAEIGAAMKERHKEDGFRWATCDVRRVNSGMLGSLSQWLLGAEVQVVWISPDRFDFFTSYKPKFEPTTAVERQSAENLWFSVNANFRDPKGKPLGWVVHESRQSNPPFPAWTGCFFVKGGKPYFGPKSLLDEVPGPIEEGTQGYPSVMKNHTVFSYVDLTPDKFFDGKKITYRSLAGTRRDGVAVFVLSGDGGVMNVSEITQLAEKLELKHATLLDGGRALQYSIRSMNRPWHFHAYNTTLPIKNRWIEQQQSPVYIGVRRKAPQIVTTQQ